MGECYKKKLWQAPIFYYYANKSEYGIMLLVTKHIKQI